MFFSGSGSLPFLHLCAPGARNTVLNRLVGRAPVCVHGQSPLYLIPGTRRDLESVRKTDGRDFQHAFHIFDIALNPGNQVLSRGDSPRIQRGPQGSGQSPGNAGDHVIEGCRVLRAGDLPAVLLLIEALDTAVHSEVDGLGEVLNVCRAVRPLMLFDTDMTGVSYCHDRSSFTHCMSNAETFEHF